MINIEGIQVLNTYVTTSPDLAGVILISILGLTILLVGFALFITKDTEAGIISIIFGTIIALLSVAGYINRVQETHYDVLINNSTPLIEVYDKYKIDGKDGDIYHLTLRREPEEDKTNDQ